MGVSYYSGNGYADLLSATLGALDHYGRAPSEVLWVGSDNGKLAISWVEFEALARDVSLEDESIGYDGDSVVPWDLVIVGDDWWLELHGDYRAATRWALKTKPVRVSSAKPFHRLEVGDNKKDHSLAGINR